MSAYSHPTSQDLLLVDEAGLGKTIEAGLVLCEEQEELDVTKKEFSGSLFRAPNDETSTINLLIGSKNFTEG